MAVDFYNQELAMHLAVTQRQEPWGLVALAKVLGIDPGLLRRWAGMEVTNGYCKR